MPEISTSTSAQSERNAFLATPAHLMVTPLEYSATSFSHARRNLCAELSTMALGVIKNQAGHDDERERDRPSSPLPRLMFQDETHFCIFQRQLMHINLSP